ncbi:MAG: pitrilysin family protein [Candidatus Peribacteraceae bacterium]|nr:pitrilysin family protein [Candidatus Peribacteraceae bacterium]
MYSVSRLPSGLTVLTAPGSGTESVTVHVFVGAGSRYERQKERGISHFLEHMFFKGGKKYPTTQAVSAAIDGVGGDFNAFTGKEYAGYFVKVAAPEIELACDVLGDMLLHARFPEEDIERERGVIIEEEHMYQDTPMYRAGWDFEEMLLGDHPLGWDTIGREEVIRSVGHDDFVSYQRLLYTPDNLVLVFAGKIKEKQSLKLAKRFFDAIEGKRERSFVPFKTYGKERVFLREKSTEQAHLVLGVPAVGALSPDHFAHKLLSIILGGNMSSRMFLRIREAKGLCYYISTETDSYLDAGVLSTRAGVDQSRLPEAIRAIACEYRLCAEKGVTAEELKRAKEYLKGKITLALEDSEEQAHFYGRQLLLYPKVRSVAEYFHEIDRVMKKQVDALAANLLQTEKFRLVVIGKGTTKKEMEQALL